ncbi:MAG: hypothetical protein JNK48_31405, partial [Bryobacterales bacterium]|nr:hypothetical protein [Bryobacterales bacterium]
MKSLADSPVHSSPEPELVLYFDEAPARGPLIRAAAVSIVLHLIATLFLATIEIETAPLRPGGNVHVAARNVTPLVMPPGILRELTQRAPQTREVSREFNVETLIPRPEMKKAPAQPAVSPKPRVGIPAPAALPDAPQIAASSPASAPLPPPGSGLSKQSPPPPPPQIQTQEKPKLTFENIPGTGRGTGNVA